MKKLLYKMKIKLGIVLFSILQNPYCYKIFFVLHYILHYIWSLPSNILFLFIMIFKVFSNIKYIARYYNMKDPEDANKIKEIIVEYMKSKKEYINHINIITWIIVLFFITIK